MLDCLFVQKCLGGRALALRLEQYFVSLAPESTARLTKMETAHPPVGAISEMQAHPVIGFESGGKPMLSVVSEPIRAHALKTR